MILPNLLIQPSTEEHDAAQAKSDTQENKEAGVETKESTPPKKEAVRYGIYDRKSLNLLH